MGRSMPRTRNAVAAALPYDTLVSLAASAMSVKGYAGIKEAAVAAWRTRVAALGVAPLSPGAVHVDELTRRAGKRHESHAATERDIGRGASLRARPLQVSCAAPVV